MVSKPQIAVLSGAKTYWVMPWQGAEPVKVPPGTKDRFIDTRNAPEPPWSLCAWEAETDRLVGSWVVEPEDERLELVLDPQRAALFEIVEE